MGGKNLVWLTDDELLLLDGKVSLGDTQVKINDLRNARDFGKDKAFILKVLDEGHQKGIISFRKGYVSCEICGKRSDISTYKTGQRRGQIKHKGSTLVSGVSFAKDFITFRSSPRLGICVECYERIKPELDIAIRELKFDYHQYLSDCPYRKDDERKCYSCGQTMFESEMGRSPTLMGSGSYSSTCPHCGTKSLIFGKVHGSTHNWRIIEEARSDGN